MAFLETITVAEVLAKYPNITIDNINTRKGYYYNDVYACASEFVSLVDYVTIRKDNDEGNFYVDGLDITTEYNGRLYRLGFYKGLTAYCLDFNRVTSKHTEIRNKAYSIDHGLNKIKKGSLKKINALLAEAEEQYLFAVDAVKQANIKRAEFVSKLDAVVKELGLQKSSYQDKIQYRAKPYIIEYEISIDKDDHISIDKSYNVNFKSRYDQDLIVDEFIEVTRKLKTLEK